MKAYVGLDLAASPRRCSGYAYILCNEVCTLAEVKCLYTDDELVNEVLKLSSVYGVIISIDAPFSLGNGLRSVDRKMISLGFRVFPPGFKAMKSLTLRAMELIKKFNEFNVSVYETHPKSALRSSRCLSLHELLDSLYIEYGVDVDNLSKDLRDAVVAAVVSYCVDRGCSLVVEDVDGSIVLIKGLCQ